jgi:hypothetical protein
LPLFASKISVPFHIIFNTGQQVSQISSFGIVTRQWAGHVKDHAFSSVSKRLISSQRHPDQFLGPASRLMDTMGTFPKTKAVDV